MTREMTLAGFIGAVAGATMAVRAAEKRALERAARIIEAEAKDEIGTYQGAIGPFEPWAPLAEATQADRVRQGFPADEPLLRTGQMRASIGHAVGDREAVVGSNDDRAVWQELGTRTIPPRSFLGGAALRKAPEAARAMGAEVVAALVGPGVAGTLISRD